MNDIAIQVENLGKRYQIGKSQQRHDTLRDALMAGLRAPWGRLRRNGRHRNDDAEDTIWALKHVSFEVKRGEVVGIIGRNGAGKSTLLKMLTRITEPTGGRAVIHGRVGSLLEVGTGFHPELTGRENTYLNGAILGMSKTEIDSKFDEIVDFSGIEKFIDTPVKRYSSGMYVRLAFAVAAHLEPEILLVDEVLAVGDAAFQKKCLGKMGDVAESGRTVLFVSHNMAAIQVLCSRALLFDNGCLAREGTSADVVSYYLRSQLLTEGSSARYTNEHFELLDVDIVGPEDDILIPLHRMKIVLRILSKQEHSDIGVHVLIEDELGYRILGLDSHDFQNGIKAQANQEVVLTFTVKELPISPGRFNAHLWIKSESDRVFEEMGLIPFDVASSNVYGKRKLDRNWHGTTVTRAAVDINVL